MNLLQVKMHYSYIAYINKNIERFMDAKILAKGRHSLAI